MTFTYSRLHAAYFKIYPIRTKFFKRYSFKKEIFPTQLKRFLCSKSALPLNSMYVKNFRKYRNQRTSRNRDTEYFLYGFDRLCKKLTKIPFDTFLFL